jgi:chondroitin 4-sulfotransferase 11
VIDHRYRCIFVHIPKTAGSSVQRLFGLDWHNHKDIGRFARELAPETFARYLKFAVIRNPWDRLVSDYNFQHRKRTGRGESRLFAAGAGAGGSKRGFHQWLEAVLDDPFRYAPADWGADVSPGIHRWSPQLDWISIGGKIAVDRVLRLEHLRSHVDALRRDLGLPGGSIPWRRWRAHGHYARYYDEASRRLVERHYEKDIEAFGYDFDRPPGGLRGLLPTRLRARSRGLISELMQAR